VPVWWKRGDSLTRAGLVVSVGSVFAGPFVV
jgi:hypothetical protein